MTHDLRFTAEKIGQRLKLITPLVFREKVPLDPFRILPLADATVDPPVSADPSNWYRIPHESYWGQPDLNFVMRSHFLVPPGWTGDIALHLPLGEAGDIFTHPEGLVYVDGKPIASADRYHHTVPLPDHLADGQRHQIALHGWTGLSGWPPDPDSQEKLFMGTCRLVTRDRPTQFLLWLANAALGTARTLLDRRSERHAILTALDRAFLTLDTRDPLGEAFYASVPEALKQLQSDLAAAGNPQDVTLHAIGHAHMDIAYLWPVAQIRRKTARTFSNALRLMQEYPTFRFSNSQAILYKFTEQDYPEIFDRVKMAVARGQWEVMGGMWVEPDLNIPDGESLVRQIVLGRRYFRQKFGEVETPVLWLPDTFGFPWCVPQLMKQAGLKWFCTNKLNWNQTNRIPASTSWWQGLDGSRVLAHVLTTPRPVQHLPFPTNYKSDLSAAEVIGTWEHSTSKRHVRDLPICFGYGDGGGGPTEGLIQTAKAYDAMPGMPRVTMSTIRETFEAIEQTADDLPIWNGEHYMEGHRGTLTSQGWIKRANRRAEMALHEAEALSAMAGLTPDLTEAWELLCLNQFHDILTGTSIREVFEDAERDYDRIFALVREVTEAAAQTLGQVQGPTVLNTTPVAVTRLATVPGAWPGQPVEGGTLVRMPDLAPYSATAVSMATVATPNGTLKVIETDEGVTVENALLRVRIGRDGQLTEVHDIALDRAVLAEGQTGNQLQVFEDRPVSWDAWDIDPFFDDRTEVVETPATLTVVERGPLRVRIRVKREYRRSTISQDILLYDDSRRIDFETEVDWHETHLLLKAAFPVDILSPSATYDTQWGVIERATHRNTSWDRARFEVPAQKWADLSEGGYGVALLNDCKYGYDICDNVMRLSLIKSATMPDTHADQGLHRFTYSLLPHPNGWTEQVIAQASDLNYPLAVVPKGAASDPLGFTCAAPNIVLSTLKPADDRDGVILRLYETHRKRGIVRIGLPDGFCAAEHSTLMEEPGDPLDIEGNALVIRINPFEIATIRLRRRP